MNPTDCAFGAAAGGESLDTLYITTAAADEGADSAHGAPPPEPHVNEEDDDDRAIAGGVFAVSLASLGFEGVPEAEVEFM